MEVLRDERVTGDFSFVHVPSLQPAHRCPFRFRASTPPLPVLSTFPSLLLPGRASPPPHAVLRHLFRKCFLMPSRSTASRPHEALRQNLRKCCVAPKQYVCPLSQVFLLFCKRKFSFCLLFRFLSLHLQCTINLIRYASLVRKSDRPSARRMEGMGCW